jgi:aldose 1-epimerase
MALTGAQFEIAAGDHHAVVVEVGAGLREYAVGDRSIVAGYPGDELPPKCSGITLVPWPNRIRAGAYSFDGVDYQLGLTDPTYGNASHGLARWVRWVAVGHSADAVTMRCDIVPQTGYPFEISVDVTYRIDALSGLTATVVAKNSGPKRAPFGVGAHPYLALGDTPLSQAILTIPAESRLIVDDALIPVGRAEVAGTEFDFRTPRPLGELRMDTGFTSVIPVGGRSECVLGAGEKTTRLWCDPAFGFLQVFTPEALSGGRTGVAFEPMTCAPDAFNSGDGLIVLEPGATWSAQWGLTPV